MEKTVTVCRQVLAGTFPSFLGNLGGAMIASCANPLHSTSDESSLQNATPVSIDWFEGQTGLASMLMGIPLNGAAIFVDGRWVFDFFQGSELTDQEYEAYSDVRVTPTLDKYLEIVGGRQLHVNCLEDDQPAVARDLSGIRLLPAFLSEKEAEVERLAVPGLEYAAPLTVRRLKGMSKQPDFISLMDHNRQLLLPLNYLIH